MRGVGVIEFGEPEVFQVVNLPEVHPAAGEIRIRVHAAAVNPTDTGIRDKTALVAKQAAEVDVPSGGRLILGIGVGWNQVEYEGLRQDFHIRGRRSEEQIQLLRSLWAEPLVTFEGRFDGVHHAGINPLPPRRRIPIWIGGSADLVLDRIGRIGDGWLGWSEAGMARIHTAARSAGRHPAEISIATSVSMGGLSVEEQLEQVERRRQGGATHCSMTTMNAGFTSVQQHINAVREFREAYAGRG
jgi:alkanesulfonate monooxygenase SsuD/methylene tetrahydromethanopterin reductase-like flavin-dependent oxidoreductase (luciferase family)